MNFNKTEFQTVSVILFCCFMKIYNNLRKVNFFELFLKLKLLILPADESF